MTITIADGRGALWQWDTGRRVKITDGADVKQIHYQNRCFGCSVDVDVEDDGTAIIPDELLQDYHTLTAYAYVTDDAGGYTKVQQDFSVYKRAKPADYVYTPTEHAGFDRLRAEIGDLADLTTEAKDTLVKAINEVALMGGRMSLRVADGYIQYSTDSGSTWQNLIAVSDLKGAGMDITGATVGQIAKITAVDDSGKPTAWEPVDMPSGDGGGVSVPKPLTYDYMPDGYPSKSVSFNVEWDGNTEGLTSLYNFYKVSDLVVDPSVFASGATLTYSDGSTDFMSIDAASGKEGIKITPGKVIFGEGQVMIFTETPEPPLEIGVYFESDEIYDVRKVTGAEVITPMAEEFLPNILDIDSIIMKSSTTDSAKKFKITVDDSGALTATEVTE